MSSYEYESFRADRLSEAAAEVARLQAALLRYGQHLPTCRRLQGSFVDVPECTCGLSVALAQASLASGGVACDGTTECRAPVGRHSPDCDVASGAGLGA